MNPLLRITVIVTVLMGLVIPQPATAQTSTVSVFVLLDYDEDGEGDIGAGEDIRVRVHCRGGFSGEDYTNEVSIAEFSIPYEADPSTDERTHCSFNAVAYTFIYDWVCGEGYFIDEPQENVLMDCKTARIWFLPFISWRDFPDGQAAGTTQVQYLPFLKK